ncbi:hypothetical protein E2C01_034248 [Portunus trituberculatus]|uniref:Uncharacterized protein n=1 Tax=Portunus trituberculatus TaxID=210409 RepID=A0A5B7F6K9_PORTR|nr:hypothetical protein [Portunus trituberculatus]
MSETTLFEPLCRHPPASLLLLRNFAPGCVYRLSFGRSACADGSAVYSRKAISSRQCSLRNAALRERSKISLLLNKLLGKKGSVPRPQGPA